MNWTTTLLEQLTDHWEQRARPRLGGLTDDEYFWEPAPGAWSIRPRAEARTAMAGGGGEMRGDRTRIPGPKRPPSGPSAPVV